jgi:ribosomal protein S1
MGLMWEEAKRRFPLGRRVRGVVTEHCPFGVFVDLVDPVARGLIHITDFLNGGQMTPDRYPPVGMAVEAIVLGHTDDRRKQVWLSLKPSRLGSPA